MTSAQWDALAERTWEAAGRYANDSGRNDRIAQTVQTYPGLIR